MIQRAATAGIVYRLSLSLLLAAALASSPVVGGSKVNKTELHNKAIHGYDPVAYFQKSRPVRGKRELSWRWMGADWHFSSVANQKLFQQNPGKYAPQYGGFCAYAVSQGYTADIDPNAWEIHNGRLYLNYNRQVQASWRKKRSSYISQADRNWPRIRKQ